MSAMERSDQLHAMLQFVVALAVIYEIISAFTKWQGYKAHKPPLFGVAGIILFIGGRVLDSSVIMAAATAIVIVCCVVFLFPSRDQRTKPKRSSVPYALLGVLALILSCGLGAYWFHAIAHSGNAPIVYLLYGTGLPVVVSIACFRLHRQRTQPSATEILQVDRRAPVLFLRSFQSDDVRVEPSGSWILQTLGIADTAIQWMGKSFEEVLGPAMSEIGPFIALGNPEDYLPTLGAYKVYRRDEMWQETVLDFLGRAKFIILLEGDTPGLSWELAEVRKRCAPHTVFVVTATDEFRRGRWIAFSKLLQEAGFTAPTTDIGAGAVLGFDGSFRPVLVRRGARYAADYSAAIEKWHKIRLQWLAEVEARKEARGQTRNGQPKNTMRNDNPQEDSSRSNNNLLSSIEGWSL